MLTEKELFVWKSSSTQYGLMSESAAWACNKGHNQVQSNFAMDLAGCPDSGEGTRAPGPIHLSLSRVIQKIWWKGWWMSREERKHGGIYWLPTWLKTVALERNTSVYPCGHFLLLYWHGRRWIISRIQGLTSPVWVLGSKEKNNVVAVHQKLAKHCEY